MIRGAMLAAVLGAVLGAQGAPAAAPERTRVAVLDLRSAGEADARAAEGLTALLASEVARRPALAVISGADVRALLGFERQRQVVGCEGGSCIAELAGALGARYLVSGEVARVGGSWLLSLALLDARTATAAGRLTRKGSSADALVDEVPGAVDALLAAVPGVGPPARVSRFDGSWDVVIECPLDAGGSGAKGYSIRFPATVREGHLVASHLAEEQPGSLQVEGDIPADGKAHLRARGRTAGPEFSIQRSVPGTRYTYGISAAFETARGTGKRLEGRPCSFTFTRR